MILTEWPLFARLDPVQYAPRIRRGLIIDGRNLLDPERVACAGLRYRGVGRTLLTETSVLANVG
jgi:UDPglucose 6-dehydrogenase